MSDSTPKVDVLLQGYSLDTNVGLAGFCMVTLVEGVDAAGRPKRLLFDPAMVGRRRVLWDARSMTDSAEETGSFYAGGLLFDRPTTPEDHVAALLRVTPADVREVARWMARPERLSVTAVGLPDGAEDAALEDVVDGWRGAGRTSPP